MHVLVPLDPERWLFVSAFCGNWEAVTGSVIHDMSLTDELQKLAQLKAEGQLSEEEFIEAKRRLLAPDADSPSTPLRTGAELGLTPRVVPKTYRSSRWSRGNLFFRDSITLGGDGILFRKGRLLGSQEERINYRAVASLRVTHGLFLANVSVETSGGSQPIFINGLWKSDARQVQEAVRVFQENGQVGRTL